MSDYELEDKDFFPMDTKDKRKWKFIILINVNKILKNIIYLDFINLKKFQNLNLQILLLISFYFIL